MGGVRVLGVDAMAAVVADVGIDRLLDELIERMTIAFEGHDPDIMVTVDRAGFHYTKPDLGLIEWMPAMELGRRVSVKTVGYHPSNPTERQVPSILASTALYDTTDGRLLAMCEATFLTSLRTGAASALATEVLAIEGAETLGVIGAGAQAVTQIHAISRIRPIRRVLVADADQSVARSLESRLPDGLEIGSIEVIAPDDVHRVLEQCDIISTATTIHPDEPPVLLDGDHRPWLHINAVGADFEGKNEIDLSLLRRAFICPDVVAQCLLEGECQQLTAADLGPDIATLLQERDDHVDRRDELTVFDSTGWSLEDLIAAELMLDHAKRLGVGSDVDLQPDPVDPYDPYEFVRA